MVSGKQILYLIFNKRLKVNKQVTFKDLIALNEYLYEIPKSFRSDMLVPARIYMNKEMFHDIKDDRSLDQLVNVASLPGIQKYAIAMPDIHQGYGFPIGGVAATDIATGGVISPGGIGYDINCGIRLLASDITEQDIKPYIQDLATALFKAVPSGVGQGGRLKYNTKEIDEVLRSGAHYMVDQGYGTREDLDFCEEKGCMPGADPRLVSLRAKKRGADQLGTLGSGNHFLEIQVVEEIYQNYVAEVFGIKQGHVVIMIHCGSRGLGHQICTDYVRIMMKKLPEFGYTLPDRELVCAPVNSKEGQDYFSAMCAAANFAWANRHLISHWVRQAWIEVLGNDSHLQTVYDVSHNIGKREVHIIDTIPRDLLVHRKGATRAFGPGRPELPQNYSSVGQPVFIPGTMGTASYVLVGTESGMNQAYGTSCHGAGRRLSRTKAKQMVEGIELRNTLEKQGIIIRCESDSGLAEEAPIAYKDINNVIDIVVGAGLADKVARLRPIAVIKGG